MNHDIEEYRVIADVYTVGSTIDGDDFGARFVSYRDFMRFEEAIKGGSYGLLVWPGGTLAERNSERYGFNFDDLYNVEDTGKPGLSEMMQYCVEHDLKLSIILPTATFNKDKGKIENQFKSFVEDLLNGKFGELPKELIFELGNEYYANFPGDSDEYQAKRYGKVANSYLNAFEDMAKDFEGQLDRIKLGIQLGKTETSTLEIVAQLDPEHVRYIDYLSHHRFAQKASGVNKQIAELERSVEHWEDIARKLGVDAPKLYLSAYNSASLTTAEIEKKYADELEEASGDIPVSFDFQTGSSLDILKSEGFIEFAEDLIRNRDTGMEQANHLLAAFSAYKSAGAEMAATYGWDSQWVGSFSTFTDSGETILHAGAVIQHSMSESTFGTKVTDLFEDNDQTDLSEVHKYGFASHDKLVLFLVAPDNLSKPFEFSVTLEELDTVYAVWGQRYWVDPLEPSDIQDIDHLSQLLEAELIAFGRGQIQSFDPALVGSNLEFEFTSPNEIVRLTIARTMDGYEEITPWHQAPSAVSFGDGDWLNSVDWMNSAQIELSDNIDSSSEVSIDLDAHILTMDGISSEFRGFGSDLFLSGSYNLDVLGGDQDNKISTGIGNDLIHSAGGMDWISTNDGNDTVFSENGDDHVFGGYGDDWINGGLGDDTLLGGNGSDVIESLSGNNVFLEADVVSESGDTQIDDFMSGGFGDDSFIGGAGNDVIIGDLVQSYFFGDDTLIGGTGDDVLQGSGGADVFVFRPGDGMDTIATVEATAIETDSELRSIVLHGRDFEPGVDRIDLSAFDFNSDHYVLSKLKQDGSDTILWLDDSSIRITDVLPKDFSTLDFIV